MGKIIFFLVVYGMNKFLILAFLFSIGCIIGWGLEVLFRHFFTKEGKNHWINPGFLAGPCLPLYGFGLCALYLLAGLEPYIVMQNQTAAKLVLFVVMAACMTLIEYIAGVIFIKRMHVKLWDYTNNWGNFQGIICPLYSFFWAVLGAVYYFFVHPHILSVLNWFSQNLAFSFVIGMFYGIFAIDLCYSFRVVSKIKKFADENEILVRYEELKRQIKQGAESRMIKPRFLLAFHSDISLQENLKNYLEKQRAAGSEALRQLVKKRKK